MSPTCFGEVPGVPEGTEFRNRIALAASGVHRPLQAGICGNKDDGAESIVLANAYEDDEDFGDWILYTGHGGRSLESGQQVADQQLTRQNLALAVSCLRGEPVRVIRKTARGTYRYDGLFHVARYWHEVGKSGFTVWRFQLQKAADRGIVTEPEVAYQKAARIATTEVRVIRESKLAHQIKALYDYRCQVCHQRVDTPAGPYAEAAHIQPLGRPHDGPDVLENLLCLCPNHHVQLDYGTFGILDNLALIGLPGTLRRVNAHKPLTRFLTYHREHIYVEQPFPI
jgi:putative restriction endonuclease